MSRGRFRQDLYFRLNVLPLHLPPLRERIGDVPALAAHFLGAVARREGKPSRTLELAALELMMQYAWPGNVRELQNVCERAAVLTSDQTIHATLIAPWLGAGSAVSQTARDVDPVQPQAQFNGAGEGAVVRPAAMIEVTGDVAPQIMDARSIVCDGRVTLEDIEREIIVATLGHNRGHRQKSATALGIGVRTLGLKLKKWKEEKLVSETL